ncbi:MAG: hypothetical protein CMN76_21030 [Spirochaetaceae bacterium]|nr:hypothetical protein [Spirochaetaceae bacterium]|tara:strand:+ start:58774 stop:59526 length:753 start_codon:yes stop_codon:yes gene_type:complete
MKTRQFITILLATGMTFSLNGCILLNEVKEVDRTFNGLPPIEFRVASQSALTVSTREMTSERVSDAISKSLLEKGVPVGPGGLQLFVQVRQVTPRDVSFIQGVSVWGFFLTAGIIPMKTMTVENQVYVVVGKSGRAIRSFQYDFETWGLTGTLLICALQFDSYPDKASEALALLFGHILKDMEEGGLFEQSIAPASRYDRLVVLKDGRSFLHVQTRDSGDTTTVAFNEDKSISVPTAAVVRNEVAPMPGF